MKLPTQQFTVLATFAAMLGTALAPLAAAEAEGEFDPSQILRTPAPQSEELLAFDMNRTIMQQTQLIRYQATEYQRKVAEERARAFVAAQRRATAAATTKSKPKPTPQAAPKKGEKTKPAEPVAEAKPKKLPRYIAVDTVKDKRASPKARKVVMIFDTQSETLVGNNLYDVQNPPPVGSTSTFETYSAQYIGAGL
jgi:hypothetical protein